MCYAFLESSVIGFISAVQVFSQSLFLGDCSNSVHPTAENWLSLHLLGTTSELAIRLWGGKLLICSLSLSLFLFQAFVVLVTMLRELYDDFKRFVRDREVNGQRYYRLTSRGTCKTMFYFEIIGDFL